MCTVAHACFLHVIVEVRGLAQVIFEVRALTGTRVLLIRVMD